MTEPTFAPHPTTERLFRALGPGMTDGDDGTLLRFLDSIGQLIGDVDDRVRGIGWELELDPETTRSPAWLGQFVGVTVPAGLTLEAARDYVVERRAFRRGSPAALVEAARAHLTGTRRVDLLERDGGAYRLRVRTYAQETPDPAAVEAALRAAKPAGLLLTYEVLTGAPYDERDAEFATFDALDASATTYDELDTGGV